MWKEILSIIFIILFIIMVWIMIQKNMREIYVPENFENFTYERGDNNDVKILTYNIQNFPWSIKSLGDKKMIKLINDHSIILLQECFSEVYDSLEKYYPDYYICRGKLKGLNIMNSGLVIMSKFPIEKFGFTEYKTSNYWSFDYLCEKGFLVAVLNTGKEKIKIINTHLQSSDFERYDKSAVLQFNELKEYLKNLKKKGEKYIVGGDFNIDINDLEKIDKIKDLEIRSPRDPTIFIDLSTARTSSSKVDTYEPFIFDYFITHLNLNDEDRDEKIDKDIKDIKDIKVIKSDYSDHNPVSIKLNF